jgi:ferric enterobactin receptor
VNKFLDVTAGIDNVLDKRHFREGNAQTTGNSTTGAYLYGAGANTYNESGRVFFMSLGMHF